MEIEKETPEGFLIKIRIEKMTYTVFRGNRPEIPEGSRDGSIVCPVPHLIFAGDSFGIEHFNPGINYVKVVKGRMIIPYKHSLHQGLRNISVYMGTAADILPVKVTHLVSPREVLEYLGLVEMKILVVDEDYPRFDLVQVKLKFPRVNVLIVKRKIEAEEEEKVEEEPQTPPDTQVIDESKIRAADTLNDKNINLLSKNPVFLSRVHLRNLELDKVKQLLFDFKLSSEDCNFISSFLNTMLGSDKAELLRHQEKLEGLKTAYDTYPYIVDRDSEQMEQLLEGDISKEAASILWMVLLSQLEDIKSPDEKMLLEEWTARIQEKMS